MTTDQKPRTEFHTFFLFKTTPKNLQKTYVFKKPRFWKRRFFGGYYFFTQFFWLFWALDLVLVKLIIEIFELCKIDMWEFCFKSRIKDNNLCYLCILVKISQIFSKFFENAFRHFLKISRRFSKFWPRTQNNYRFLTLCR